MSLPSLTFVLNVRELHTLVSYDIYIIIIGIFSGVISYCLHIMYYTYLVLFCIFQDKVKNNFRLFISIKGLTRADDDSTSVSIVNTRTHVRTHTAFLWFYCEGEGNRSIRRKSTSSTRWPHIILFADARNRTQTLLVAGQRLTSPPGGHKNHHKHFKTKV